MKSNLLFVYGPRDGSRFLRPASWLVGLLLAMILVTSAYALQTGPEPGVLLLRSDAQGVTLELSAARYELKAASVDGVTCRRIEVAGYVEAEEAGAPQLPRQVVLLGVPPGADLELEATPSATERVPGPLALCSTPPDRAAPLAGREPARWLDASRAPQSGPDGSDLYPAAAARVQDLGFVRSQRLVRLEMAPFRVDRATGEVWHTARMRVVVRFKGGEQTGSPIKEPDEFESALKSVVLNYETARRWRGNVSPPETGPWTPPDPGYKISVDQEGIYSLDRADLVAAGLPAGSLDPRNLRLYRDGQEVAIRVTGEADGRFDEGDRLTFYGQPADTRYVNASLYWLTYGTARGLRMSEKFSLAGGTSATSFRSSVRLEENRTYISAAPMQPGFDHWYWLAIQAAGLNTPGRRDFPFTVTHLATEALTASLEVMLIGGMDGTHHVRLYVNGNQVREDRWNQRSAYHASVDFPQSSLREGNNVLRVELANDTPNQLFDLVHADWFRVSYQRTYVAEADALAFGGDEPGAWSYQVTGFSGEDVDLFDITDPARVVRIDTSKTLHNVYLPVITRRSRTGTSVAAPRGELILPPAPASAGAAPGEFTLRFGDRQAGARRYLALAAARHLKPASIQLDTPSALQAGAGGADYVIITHPDFLASVQPLAARRTAEGLRVRVVDVRDVYDEFGYGMMSAEAIHAFLAYAYGHWPRPAPSYVLLVGDGTYDFRRYLSSSAPTFIPPYLDLIDPTAGETATDNRYASVAGGDILPDVHIGRLPANTPAEAEAMVAKIVTYESASEQGDWNRNVLFVADDLEGGGGNFYDLSDGIADGYADPPTNTMKILPAPYIPSKVYLGRTCPDENPSVTCRQQIVDTLSITGSLLVSYVGHGTKAYWAQERLLDPLALPGLANERRLPIILPMTCDEGYFQEPQAGSASFGEVSVRTPQVGAVASWSPTGYGLSSGHDYLERGLFLALFHEGMRRFGASATAAKLYLAAHTPAGQYDDLIETFLLLGDPALRVQTVP